MPWRSAPPVAVFDHVAAVWLDARHEQWLRTNQWHHQRQNSSWGAGQAKCRRETSRKKTTTTQKTDCPSCVGPMPQNQTPTFLPSIDIVWNCFRTARSCEKELGARFLWHRSRWILPGAARYQLICCREQSNTRLILGWTGCCQCAQLYRNNVCCTEKRVVLGTNVCSPHPTNRWRTWGGWGWWGPWAGMVVDVVWAVL